MTRPRQTWLVTNVNMGLSHVSLEQVFRDNFGQPMTAMAPGEFAMFVNTAQTKVKVMTRPDNGGYYYGYYAHRHGRIRFSALKQLPNFFAADKQDMGYTEALRAALTQQLLTAEGPHNGDNAT